MSSEEYSLPILYSFADENEETKEIEPNLLESTEEELNKNVSKIFYDKPIKNEKENSSTNYFTPEDENELNKLNDSNIKESNVLFPEDDFIFENTKEKKFKILNIKPKRCCEKDALLKRFLLRI